MDIKELILDKGGVLKNYNENDVIFEEARMPKFYYHLIEGCVKQVVSNENGRIWVLEYVSEEQCFGSSALFTDKKYLYTAIAVKNSSILVLHKDKFFRLLEEDISLKSYFLDLMASKLYNRYSNCRCIVHHSPEERIIAFLNLYKQYGKNQNEKKPISFTRQEIADFTGLRVETVIRTISRLKEKCQLDVVNHKIYY